MRVDRETRWVKCVGYTRPRAKCSLLNPNKEEQLVTHFQLPILNRVIVSFVICILN